MKVCLACNAGGHLNQIKEIVPYLNNFYFVTTERPDAIALLENYKKYFVCEIDRNLFKLIKNAFQSFSIFLKERPDIVVSTGAGGAFATCVIAKIFGKKVYYIESFARVEELSLTAKLVYPFADKFFVQSPKLLKYKKAKICGPLISVNPIQVNKKDKIFVTIGSTKFQFDRLIKAADNLKTNYEIFAQIGNSNYIPKNIKFVKWLKPEEAIFHMQESKIAIVHGGTASISNALNYGCKVIVVPRLKRYNEHVDDHQIEITKEFEKIGVIKAVYDISYLQDIIDTLEDNSNKIILEKNIELILAEIEG